MSLYLYGAVNLKSAQVDGHHLKFKIVTGKRPLGTGLPVPDNVLGKESGGFFRDYKDSTLGLQLYVWQATGKDGDGVSMFDLHKLGVEPDPRARAVGRVKLLKEVFRRHESQNEDQVNTYTMVVECHDQPELLRLIIDQPTQVAISAHIEQYELPLDEQPKEGKRSRRAKAEQRELFESDRLPAGIDTRSCDDCDDGTMRPGERDGVSLWCCDNCPATAPWVDPLADLADEQLHLEADNSDAEPAEPAEPVAPAPTVSERQMAEWMDTIAERLLAGSEKSLNYYATMGLVTAWLDPSVQFGNDVCADLVKAMAEDERFDVDARAGEGVIVRLQRRAEQPSEEPNMIERANKARRRK